MYKEMDMVILMKMENIFKDFTNILMNNLFSGSSLNTSSSSCTPRQVYRDLVPARLELEGGVHSRFEERLGVGDSMGKVVVHRPGGGRGVKHCDQVGQMEWVGCLSVYLRQSQITYSSLVQSIMWPCVSRLQTVVGLRNIKKHLRQEL